MSLHLVSSQPTRPAGLLITDADSGLTCHFDGRRGGVLFFEVRGCCRYAEDDFLGAALLQLAVADAPIQWLVPHQACAARVAAVLDEHGIDRISVSGPLAA
ncbi:hypothetical protein [Enemella evansiae]|uniref:hypothetical protein n=1 Tax=Enemella evansiae TaxID=2016499 RepID=UPI000B95DAE1|nr:hypothetical protein [Enemella evansiae]OYO02906.1 hypothetical protein CGZ96_01745 [Enemella evansiae]OYO12235.1 hypothetical protein CGZ98_08645 [Enemella evansiae]PFG69353.1 hypothetical protein B0O41_4210 [Propionibacteriaceae bacterium ES.041]